MGPCSGPRHVPTARYSGGKERVRDVSVLSTAAVSIPSVVDECWRLTVPSSTTSHCPTGQCIRTQWVGVQLPNTLRLSLQFLLSQAHRLQALELLGRFLDLGPWAVHSALTVGIFPYVLKLLGRWVGLSNCRIGRTINRLFSFLSVN